MLNIWLEFPAWLRMGIALLIAVIGVLTFIFASVRAGAVLSGVGFVLLLVGGKSDSEKNGYRF